MSDRNSEILVEKVRELQSDTENPSANTATILKEKRELSGPMTDAEAKAAMKLRSRRAFLVSGLAAAAGIVGWSSLSDKTKGTMFRRTFEFNETVSQFFYNPERLATEYLPSQISPARTNGYLGIESEIDQSAWTLAVGGLGGTSADLILTLDAIKKLPRTEMITELRCIEGWSTVVHWAGARFSDFVAAYLSKGRESLPAYVSLTTPDEKYYVGWDMPSIMHPQTLLAYEMNGEALKPENGAPLRLASATKYGIKLLKRIGRINFTDERPADYWAERGYDWYSGH